MDTIVIQGYLTPFGLIGQGFESDFSFLEGDGNMAQTPTAADLYTTVRNSSGAARVFGFLGEHGMRLAANESFTQRGDIVGKLGATTSKRKFEALERALIAGDLVIIKSPALYLYDVSFSDTRKVVLKAGDLGFADPTWEATGSATFVNDDN